MLKLQIAQLKSHLCSYFVFTTIANFTYLIRQIYSVAILHFYSIFSLEISVLQSVTKFYMGCFPHLKHIQERLRVTVARGSLHCFTKATPSSLAGT